MKYLAICLGILIGVHPSAWSMFQQDTTYFTTRLEQANRENVTASNLLTINTHEAIRSANRALGILEQIKHNGYLMEGRLSTVSRDQVLYAEIQGNYIIAKAYQSQKEYSQSVKYMQSALKLAETYGYAEYEDLLRVELNDLRYKEEENTKGFGKILLGAKRAIRDVMQNEDLKSVSGDLGRLTMDIHENRAATFEEEDDYDNAIKNYLKALEIADKHNDTLRISDYQNKVAELKLKKGDIKEARLLSENNTANALTPPELYTDEGESPLLPLTLEETIPPSARPSAFNKRNSSSNPENQRNFDEYRKLSEKLRALGDYEGALDALNEYAEQSSRMQALIRERVEDSLRTKDRIDSTRKVIDYLKDTNLKREVELQEKNIQILERERQMSYIIVGGAGIVAIALLLYLLFMFQRKANSKLKDAYQGLNEAHEQLKSTQAQLVESEKMASLGQLTAGIAHEINNPVNFISGNVAPLKRDVSDLSEMLEEFEAYILTLSNKEEALERVNRLKQTYDYPYIKKEIEELIAGIEEGAFRTAEIVKGLRNFARVDEDMPKWYDVRVGLDSTLALLRHKTENIELVREYHEVPEILCLPGKLNQVFMNVLTNAIQAMPDGGKITITTEVFQPIEAVDKGPRDSQIRISVSDEGAGIPAKIKNRIFDPFFTTKDVGVGTGLGLSISKGIVEKHKGLIWVEDNVPVGTKLNIVLPKELAEKTSDLALEDVKKHEIIPDE